MIQTDEKILVQTDCDHCGQPCEKDAIRQDGLSFCCMGCQTVYQILEQNKEGIGLTIPEVEKYAFLESEEIIDALLSFRSDQLCKVSFRLPEIHCSSCIQILEKLPELHQGIMTSRIDFPNKRVSITYFPEIISLRKVAELLSYVGYEPEINLSSADEKSTNRSDKELILKLGSAGFIFGNVMLLSFPEYLGLHDPLFERFFGYLSLAFCIPLVTYSASDYLKSAYASILNGGLNIDVPISIGILALFGRSAFDILSHTGSGYLDSLAGFVFFLLIGRWFQKKTYDKISFDRTYESYFPLHASKWTKDGLQAVMLRNIRPNDVLYIRSGEIIPCDAELLSEKAEIDYSFVTGEERSTLVAGKEKIYAGGKNLGASVKVRVIELVDQGYLTRLWEEKEGNVNEDDRSLLTDRIGSYFTLTILLIAGATLGFWLWVDPGMAMNAFTSVLIIACPCVIALSIPFTYGTLLSLLAGRGIYVKSTRTLEQIQNADTIIFDKTGTLTSGKQPEISFEGPPLSQEEANAIGLLTQQSAHPLSRLIFQALELPYSNGSVENYHEINGQGLEGRIKGHHLRLGSSSFINKKDRYSTGTSGQVHIEIDDQYRGCFSIRTQYRPSLKTVLNKFRSEFNVQMLSGDEDFQRDELINVFGFDDSELQFRQSPMDKKTFVQELQQSGHGVIMVGDGLNDAGALRQSNAGIVVTEDLNNFTPASDVVLDARRFDKLPETMTILKKTKGVLYFMYAMAIVYNIIGLFFAVQGLLSPIVAAILMPSSSISMVVTGYLLTRWRVYRSTRDWDSHGKEITLQEAQKLSVA